MCYLRSLSGGADVAEIEALRKVVTKGGEFDRYYDLIVNVGGQIIKIEKKAWSAENIKKYLVESLRKNVASPTGEPPGQLYKDLLQLHSENYCCTRWSFDARAADLKIVGSDGVTYQGADAIRKIIVDEVKSNGAIQEGLMKHLELDKDALYDLVKMLDGNLARFVEISEI